MKKGVVFTIASLVISGVLVSTFFTFQSTPIDQSVDSVTQKIQNTNNFIERTDIYLQDLVRVRSYELMDNLTRRMEKEGSYFDDFDQAFENCIVNGSHDSKDCTNMSGRVEEFESFTESNLTLDPEIELMSVSLNQSSPWSYDITLESQIYIDDSYAEWNTTRVVNETVPIIGLLEPTYRVNPSVSTDYESSDIVVKGDQNPPWGTADSVLQNVTFNKGFFHYNGSYSFLDKMRNESSPKLDDCCGIVNIIPESNTSNSDDCDTNIDFFNTNEKRYRNAYASADIKRIDFDELDSGEQSAVNYDDDNPHGLNGTTLPEGLITMTDMNEVDGETGHIQDVSC